MSALSHFVREHDGRQARFHLREEPDGSGLLLANAAAGVRLSESGVAIARALLQPRPDAPAAIVRALARRFAGVARTQLQADVAAVRSLLDELTVASNRYPITNLDEPGATLHRRTLGAPLCADVTVHSADAVRPRLRALWDAGIPQVVLVPADDLPATELARLVEHVEDLGAVCGVRARASMLDVASVSTLAAAGLDHLDLYFAGPAHPDLFGEGDRERFVELVAAAHAADLCPTAIVPLTAVTIAQATAIVDALVQVRPGAVTVYAIATRDRDDAEAVYADALPQAAASFEELTDRKGLGLVWAPPVERTSAQSIRDVARAGPRAASEGSIRITADGDVLPPTGPAASAGRIDRDPWPQIWQAAAFRIWREVADDPPRCATCPGLASCAAGCPRDAQTWAHAEAGAA